MAFSWLKKQNEIVKDTQQKQDNIVKEENKLKNKKTEITISLKELEERLSEEEKKQIMESLQLKIKYISRLELKVSDLRHLDKIRHLYYKKNEDNLNYLLYKSDTKEILFYFYEYTGVFEEFLYLIFKYFCEYLSLYTNIFNNENESVNITFYDIWNEKNKSNLEIELLNLAFYSLIPEEEFKQELKEVSSYKVIFDKKWFKDAFIYACSKKYQIGDDYVYELMLYLYANTLNDSLALSKEQENIYKFIMCDEDINDKDKTKTKK